jgi:iron complex outermembrane receptor protein
MILIPLFGRKNTASLMTCLGAFCLIHFFVVLWGAECSPAMAMDDDSGAAVRKLKQLSSEDLMEIEVTSISKRPEKLWETSSAVQVITDDDIRRSVATSIPEARRLVGNFNMVAQNSHDRNISAREFNSDLSNKLCALMDGRTVSTPLFSDVLWDVPDYVLEGLDRLEVFSGPGGTLLGATAVKGVINITTKNAMDTQGHFVESAVGSDLKDAFGVRYGGVISSGVYFRVYGKYVEHTNGQYADGTDAANSWQLGQGGFRLDSETHPGIALTLRGDMRLEPTPPSPSPWVFSKPVEAGEENRRLFSSRE